MTDNAHLPVPDLAPARAAAGRARDELSPDEHREHLGDGGHASFAVQHDEHQDSPFDPWPAAVPTTPQLLQATDDSDAPSVSASTSGASGLRQRDTPCAARLVSTSTG
jgi:hypothetical protein